jgi:hypothetical protein
VVFPFLYFTVARVKKEGEWKREKEELRTARVAVDD